MKIIYVLGYWSNPYSAGKEYFWFRCHDGDIKTARRLAVAKQERGQPTQFTNWCKGKNMFYRDLREFLTAAKSVGLNPRLDVEEVLQLDAV